MTNVAKSTNKARKSIGGSFAPPLTDEKIAQYEAMIESAPQPFKDAMENLMDCVKQWWELPWSVEKAVIEHPLGIASVIPLDDKNMNELYEHIPWDHEIKGIQELLEELPSGTMEFMVEGRFKSKVVDQAAYDLRNAAFHLLWFVKELNLDREPITNDLIRV